MVEVGHREVRLGEVAVFDPRVLQVALVEHGFPAVDPLDQGIRQIGLEKVRLAHVGRDLLLGSDIGILQVGFLEVGLGEVVPVGEPVGQRLLENTRRNHPQQRREDVDRFVAVAASFRREEPSDENCRGEPVGLAFRGELSDRRIELLLEDSAAGGLALDIEESEHDRNSGDKQRNEEDGSLDVFQYVTEGIHGRVVIAGCPYAPRSAARRDTPRTGFGRSTPWPVAAAPAIRMRCGSGRPPRSTPA